MVWGAIGPNYKSPLIWFPDGVNSKNYIQALDANLIFEELNIQFPEGFIYQQDGARPHTSAEAMEYLTAKAQMLPSDLKWPASSPDVSPIENIWAYMKRRIHVQALKTTKDLFLAVQKIWEDIPIDLINHLMESLKPRIFALEGLHGKSLVGFGRMIESYRLLGIESQENILAIRDAHCVTEDVMTRMRTLLNNLLNGINDAMLLEQRNSMILEFENEANDINSLLPR
jgi:hypothetical protein